jgi:hypothetical protein
MTRGNQCDNIRRAKGVGLHASRLQQPSCGVLPHGQPVEALFAHASNQQFVYRHVWRAVRRCVLR